MTIKEFAKEQGITTQAVYARIKAAGIDLQGIKKPNTAELTADGLEILNAVFAKNDGTNGAKIAEYKAELKMLQVKVEKLEKELEDTKEAAERWRQQAETWLEMLQKAQEAALNSQSLANKLHESLQDAQRTAQQAQALNMASIQALKAAPNVQRLTWWQRLTGRRLKAADQAEQTDQADRAESAEKPEE